MNVRTNLTELMRMALDRADDQTFVTALQADPRAALSQTFGVTFVQQDELTDDDLEHVVGGVGSPDMAAIFGEITKTQKEVMDKLMSFMKQMSEQHCAIATRV